MPAKTNQLARRIVEEVHRATGGRLNRWHALDAIADEIGGDRDALAEAFHLAAKRRWIAIAPARIW